MAERKFAYLYRTLTQKVPTGEEDIVILSPRGLIDGEFPLCSIEGVFLSNLDPFERFSEEYKIIPRDQMQHETREFGGVFVPLTR